MKKIIIISIILFLFNSCKKESLGLQKKCENNCAPIYVNGRVIDASSQTGMKDVPITLVWSVRRSWCLFDCRDIILYNTKTKSDGTFSFQMDIDTSFFNHDYLILTPTTPAGFTAIQANKTTMGRYVATGLQQINYEYFPITSLQINLRRNQADSFRSFQLNVFFKNTQGLYYNNSSGNRNMGDTTFNIQAPAGMYSRIYWTKVFNPGVFLNYIDSIKCEKNRPNYITINY